MKLYNSLTKSKEEFSSFTPDKLNVYVCGITPYDTTHLGHAFTYIAFDILIRIFKLKGYKVNYSQNVTDINDRDNDILKRAREQGKSWQELSSYWTNLFLSDMEFLNWIRPTNFLYASNNINVMINLIKRLIDNNMAYQANGNVYLNTKKVKNYGKLSKLNKRQMLKTASEFEEDIDNANKIHPLDVTLWRAKDENQQAHIPFFESPFGLGRPGWHIECSAMSINSLAEQIDIHGGGKDLIYPHHEAEIAQSEGATNKIPFAKFWMHTGQVFYKAEKMSKSLGNLIMVSNLRKAYSANEIRYMLLSNHYRADWEYTDELIKKSSEDFNIINNHILNGKTGQIDLTGEVMTLLENDLNTPQVLNLILKKIKMTDPLKTKIILENLGFIF